MSETNYKPNLALDFLIVAVAVSLVVLSLKLGLRVGHPVTVGPGAVLGGVYLVYLGLLFLLSYLFPEACHVFSFMRYVCEKWSRPRSRHTALFYCGLLLVIGVQLLLLGLGVF
jgi:hypothetical protein